jgi:hypothetical protein
VEFAGGHPHAAIGKHMLRLNCKGSFTFHLATQSFKSAQGFHLLLWRGFDPTAALGIPSTTLVCWEAPPHRQMHGHRDPQLYRPNYVIHPPNSFLNSVKPSPSPSTQHKLCICTCCTGLTPVHSVSPALVMSKGGLDVQWPRMWEVALKNLDKLPAAWATYTRLTASTCSHCLASSQCSSCKSQLHDTTRELEGAQQCVMSLLKLADGQPDLPLDTWHKVVVVKEVRRPQVGLASCSSPPLLLCPGVSGMVRLTV